MTDIRIATKANPDATLTELTGHVWSRIRIGSHDQSARQASWVMIAPQHTSPLKRFTFVAIWDELADGQSMTAPFFEGFIESVTPGSGSNEVEYIAYDATELASRHATVMAFAWDDATTPDEAASPRITFNSPNDRDQDYTQARGLWLTVGNMIATMLQDTLPVLRFCHAAPDSGDPYDADEIDALVTIPQEKVVLESAGIREGVENIAHWEPAKRFLLEPGTRLWRFWDIKTADEVDFTLNDPSADYIVLSHEIHRSGEGRYPAVEIYGPQRLAQVSLTLGDGDLEIVATEPLQTDIGTCCNVDGIRVIQLTDESKWKLSRILLNYVDAQIGNWEWMATKSWALFGYFPDNNQGQFEGWRLFNGWDYDSVTGRIYFPQTSGQNYLVRYNPDPEPGEPRYENPTDIRFECAYYTTPFMVRWPEEGFDGTSYDDTNAWSAVALRLRDEALVVGLYNNEQVTTEDRLESMTGLAKVHHDFRKDITYGGAVVLQGIHYEFLNLMKRINLNGKDEDGVPLDTDYDTMGAALTDCDLDFTMQTTTLTFGSDFLQSIGVDPEAMKAKLGVRALHRIEWYNVGFNTVLRNKVSQDRIGLHAVGDTLQTTFTVSAGSAWVDDFGNQG